MNEPWCYTEDQAERLTHRRAVLLVQRYTPDVDKSKDFEKRVEAELKENERAFEAKSLEAKRKEYWAFCAESGCREEDIQKSWEAYLRGET